MSVAFSRSTLLAMAGIVISSAFLISPAHAVVGGLELDEESRAKSFGPLVSLHVDKNGDSEDDLMVCGGTKINANTILTAAHCVADSEGTFKSISIRGNSLNFLDGGVLADAVKMIPHPEFDPETLENDIALIKFESSELADVPVAELAGGSAEVGSEAVLAGWGLTESGSLPETGLLRAVGVEVLSEDDCTKRITPYALSDKVFCVGPENSNVAAGSGQGDSGGPIWVSNEGKLVVVGVDSWAASTIQTPYVGPGDATVATDVAKYHTWLDEQLNS